MSRHLHGLNDPQREAVTTISGPLLVLAGAGTGKTRVVTCRIAEILAKGIAPGAVCAVTFTNKAAAEMKERTRALLPGRDISAMVVSTFHSLGLRILREFGAGAGFRRNGSIADESDQLAIMTDVLREAGISRNAWRPRDACFRISSWKNAGITPDVADGGGDGDEILAHVYERYDDELRRRGLFDFDDLILKPLHVFQVRPDALETLRERWRYLLVDEYQDTNGCQYEIVKALAGTRKNLCVVGDDDQSIYAWRGADPRRILRFTRDFPGARVVTLDQNYRSTGRILKAANTLIVANQGRREKNLWSAMGDGDPVSLYKAEDEKDEVDFVAARILSMVRNGEAAHGDIAILFRANSQCRPLEQALRARAIPYRVVGTRSFFDRREVRDLLSFLRLVRNPADDSAFLRIANVPPRGIGKGALDRIMDLAAEGREALLAAMAKHAADLPRKAARGADALGCLLQQTGDLAEKSGVAAAMEHLLSETGYREYLGMVVEDALELKARLAVVDDLVESARSHDQRSRGGLEAYLDALALRDDDRPESKEEGSGVTLLTMHAAKGLEYPAVFLVGLEEGILPHANSLADGEEGGIPDDRAVEEERRLFYVGITRARRRLILSCARRRTRFGRDVEREISRFVEEIGFDDLQIVDARDDTPADPEAGRATFAQIRASLAARRQDRS